ncbi:MAG: (2Fe-2S)-binding protein [Chloroflexi bacterium]|nr:(2Fe-2S)-binding protein [Chloroflexota bacterium]MBU1751295.1 (2Fe-2S)-binding protein [Chloroflexota bacterium]MBU1878582.1 (2Fe-2S)-binding protein [Chloroflexota bacterium]
MRIQEHPVLEFEPRRKVLFTCDGREVEGYEGEPIAAALHAAGIKVLRRSIRLHRPRGFFCANGKCASCLMVVDGEPNVMTCVTPLREGMIVETQRDKGVVQHD